MLNHWRLELERGQKYLKSNAIKFRSPHDPII
jgi:hypothetical protein